MTILTTVFLLRRCRGSALRWRRWHAETLEGMPLQSLAAVALHSNSVAHRLITIAVMTSGILGISAVRLSAGAVR